MLKKKYSLSVVIFLVLSCIGIAVFAAWNGKRNHLRRVTFQETHLTPSPKIINFNKEKATKIAINPNVDQIFYNGHVSFFKWVEKSFNKYKGAETQLTLKLKSETSLPDSIDQYLNHKEAYYLKYEGNTITIVGRDSLGILNGLTTLKKHIEAQDGKLTEGYIIDWPDQNIRAFHFSANGISEETAMKLLKKAREYQYNTLVVKMTNGVNFDASIIPVRKNAWSEDFLQRFSRVAHEFGMNLIPEVKLLSHQETNFFMNWRHKKHAHLMYNPFTYNPSNPNTKEIVKNYLDKIIQTMHPEIIHIGHDEVRGIYELPPKNKRSRNIPNPLPAHLFKDHILFVHNYLTSKGVKVWMWGDMFLNQNSDAYSGMFRWSLHGNQAYAQLIDEIPKDIVICDWHYWDNQKEFPSVDFFTEHGFKVVGATWRKTNTIKNFSKYVYKRRNKKAIGMMATTWWTIRRGEKEIVDKTVKESSEYFWNAQ